MKELLEFILENILKDKDFSIETTEDADKTTFIIKVPETKAGLVIGKGGRTIKAIRNLLKVKATLEKKLVFLSLTN